MLNYDVLFQRGKLWRIIRLMQIDAHVHYTPPAMRDSMPTLAEEEPYWALLAGADPGVQGWVTADRMIEDMDRANIDKVVLQSEYRMKHDSCTARNDQALEIIRRYPDRVIAFACLQPKAGQRALDELKRCVDGGMRGVGELNPYGQGHTLDDPEFLQLVEACIGYDLPLNLHVSEEIGHFYLGKSTTPLLHYYQLACRYPEARFILAHWGGGLLFYEMMPEVRRNLRNVWYDTAASPLLFPTSKIFKTALNCVSHRKLLYGSDYPLLIYPLKQQEPDMRPFLAEIDALQLAEDVYRDVMGDNAARLLGLLPAETAAEPVSGKGKNRREEASMKVTGLMPVSAVAGKWQETKAVFDRYGIPWKESIVPFWEPIVQAAAARGLPPERQRKLVDELNQAIAGRNEPGANSPTSNSPNADNSPSN